MFVMMIAMLIMMMILIYGNVFYFDDDEDPEEKSDRGKRRVSFRHKFDFLDRQGIVYRKFGIRPHAPNCQLNFGGRKKLTIWSCC